MADGQLAAGIYRRSVMRTSGRYAMLNDGMDSCLVLLKAGDRAAADGQQLAATLGRLVRDGFTVS